MRSDSSTSAGNRSGQKVPASRPDWVEWVTFALGPCLFVILVAFGYVATVKEWHDKTMGSYLQAVAGGAALLAIGHSIHRSARLNRSHRPDDSSGSGAAGPESPHTDGS